MGKIIEFLIEKSKIINLILIIILFMGIFSILNIKKQDKPPNDYGGVIITTVYPGGSVNDVEAKITNKIEKEIKTVDDIKDIGSVSMENYSIIEVEFEEKSDYDKVKNDIQKVLDRIEDLPDDIKGKPEMVEINEDTRPLLEIALTGTADYALIRKYAYALEKDLMSSSLVGEVQKIGYLKREVKIEVNQEKLKNQHIALSELIAAVKTNNFMLSTGDLIENNKEKKYIVMSEFENPLEVENVIIRSGFQGNSVLVSNVSVISDSYEKPDKYIRYNGKDSINLVILKKPNADLLKSVKAVKKIYNSFIKDLPEGVEADIVVDYSEEVNSLLKMVIKNTIVGFILVVIVLFILLNFRIAFWTAMGIPTSILMAFILFPVFGIQIHYISLVAFIIVLGMLVDDAIIIAENVYRYREMGLSSLESAKKGVKEVMWPVITTVLTTVIAFSPILLMTGTMGKIFYSIPVVVALLLGCSLLEAFIVLPVHIAHVKLVKRETIRNRVYNYIEKVYEKIIKYTLKHKVITIIIFCLIFALSIFLFFKSKFVLLNTDEGLRASILYETEKGTTLNETSALTNLIEEKLNDFSREDVTGFVTTVGLKKARAANFGEPDIYASYVGNILIHFTPPEKRKKSGKQIVEEIENKLKDLKKFKKLKVELYSDAPPFGKPITVTVISNNNKERDMIVKKLKDFLKEQPAVSNIEDNQEIGKKKIEIKLDHNLMSRLQVNPLKVAETMRVAFEGLVITKLLWEGEEIDYRVILDKVSRSDKNTIKNLTIENIKQLRVENIEGRLIPIGKFIKQNEKDEILRINHYNGDRAITITSDLDTEIIAVDKFNNKIRKKFLPIVKKYPGMQMKFEGEDEEIFLSFKNFLFGFVLACLGIYFILVILFNSYTQPFLVMLAIPFSFTGVIIAFFLHRIPLGMPAMIGFLGLMGVVVNDSLVMISFLNKKRKESGLSIDAVAEGAKKRLRPILLTTITTAAGLFPMAYGLGGKNYFASPMTMTIAWGLVFATFITLILLPALYYTFARTK